MSVQKPSIPKGTRDFTPAEMVRRNYIFSTVRSVFELFGYLPIETPAMENLTTLLGKYGEEGDKLIFKILNSGNYLDGYQHPASSPAKAGSPLRSDIQDLTKHISEKGLRYDLTVPFARFVVQHQNELVFPFKRYQIQPVWRADRPQKGRYREFFQCDVDVIGSPSLLYEAELVQIIDEIFSKLGIGVTVHLNNRKILTGICEVIDQSHNFNSIITALDKLEKKGKEGVVAELNGLGIDNKSILRLFQILIQFEAGDNYKKLELLDGSIGTSNIGLEGIIEIKNIFTTLENLKIKSRILFDPTLARGLNYYTGTIIEVKASNVAMGSLCGGGRYDDLTGIFGLPGMSGVGVSFGADRIYDVMLELNKFPATISQTTRVLFANFGPEEALHALGLTSTLRKKGIASEIYPDAVKMKKQLEYANRKNIPFVVMIGKDEIEKGVVTMKIMATGEQKEMRTEELITLVTSDE